MSWVVVDPKYATRDGVKVARVEVPYFPDEVQYEELLGTAFSGEAFADWLLSNGVVILATGRAYESLERLMGSDVTDVPESAVRDEVAKLAIERQCVVLRWFRDGTA